MSILKVIIGSGLAAMLTAGAWGIGLSTSDVATDASHDAKFALVATLASATQDFHYRCVNGECVCERSEGDSASEESAAEEPRSRRRLTPAERLGLTVRLASA